MALASLSPYMTGNLHVQNPLSFTILPILGNEILFKAKDKVKNRLVELLKGSDAREAGFIIGYIAKEGENVCVR